MKILHTSDLHLKEINDKSWQTLEGIINYTKINKIDVLVIAGDLFDDEIAFNNLRVQLRQLFVKTDTHILIIPGNHDYKAFNVNGLFFGENVKIFNNTNFIKKNENYFKNFENSKNNKNNLKNNIDNSKNNINSLEYNRELKFETIKEQLYFDSGIVRFIPFPYFECSIDSIFDKLLKLNTLSSKDKINILIYHGELLDSFYSSDDFGNEGQKRYLPVKLSYFEELNFDYILSGHFHTNFNIYRFKNKNNRNGYFIYPGAPLSLTEKEEGARKASLLIIENNLFSEIKPPLELDLTSEINSFSFFKIDFKILSSYNSIEEIAKKIKNEIDKLIGNIKNIKIKIIVDGFYDIEKYGLNEQQFNKYLNEQFAPQAKFNKENIDIQFVFNIMDMSIILNNELYKKVIKKIESFDNKQKQRLENLLVKAMYRSLI